MRALFTWLKVRFFGQLPPTSATQASSGDQSPVFRDVKGSATAHYHANSYNIIHVHEAASFHRDDRRVPRQLPDRPVDGRLFGRDEELRELRDRLRRGEHSSVVGPAGLGKTALAAEAIRAVIGEDDAGLLASPFPDGVVLLDLYRLKGRADDAWNALANALIGGDHANLPARERAERACRNRRVLVIIEGAEEADGRDQRCRLTELLGVLEPGNRQLVLTRDFRQIIPANAVQLTEALDTEVAGDLFDQIAGGRVAPEVRDAVLELLQGHPLALTWAANLLARGDESPQQLLAEWTRSSLPSLSDPIEARHTLQWLFERSVRGLSVAERTVLEGAGLLAHAEFPLAAMAAAIGDAGEPRPALQRLVQSGLLRLSSTRSEHWHFTHVLGYQFARRESGSDPELRVRLAGWIQAEFAGLLSSFERGAMSKMLLQTSSLFRVDEDQRLWFLVQFCLYDGVDRITAVGQLDLVASLLNSVKSWMDTIDPPNRDDPYWRRERGVLCNHLGRLQQDQGDLAAALRSYSDGRDIRLKLAQSDPSNAQWQRDLSISYDQLGGVQQAQGDLAAALRSYSDGRDIALHLAQSDPSNAQWQRDLSISHDKLGGVQQAQGDLAAALRSYSDGHDIRLKLARSDPSNARWQRDLSVSHDKLGGVQHAQGDLAVALRSYSDSKNIRLKLARSDPSNAQWQRDLAFSLTTLADLAERRGLRIEALGYAEESLGIDERLASLDQTNVTWQDNVRVCRAMVARLREP